MVQEKSTPIKLILMMIISSHFISSVLCSLQHRRMKVNLPNIRSNFTQMNSFNVDVTFIVQDISSIKPVDMEFKMDFSVVYNWTIHHSSCTQSLREWMNASSHHSGNIRQTNHESTLISTGDKYHLAGVEASRYFWIPDASFMDVKKLDAPNGVSGSTLLSVIVSSANHCSLVLETSLSATVACFFSFRLSPYDQQICYFRMRSHSYPLPYLKLNWSSQGVMISRDYHLSLNHYEAYFRFNHTIWHSFHITSDDYSTLLITFKFNRKLSNFAVSVVIPTVLMVTVAYSSFWIPVDSGPGRFLLTVLTLLALVTQFSGLRLQQPAISYVSAGDIWLITCMMFVFVAIIELAIVNYLDRRRKSIISSIKQLKQTEEAKHQTKIKQIRDKFNRDLQYGYSSVRLTPSLIKALDAEEDVESPKNLDASRLRPFGRWTPGDMLTFADEATTISRKVPSDLAVRIDIVMRIAFPILFSLFNLLYWSLLLTRSV